MACVISIRCESHGPVYATAKNPSCPKCEGEQIDRRLAAAHARISSAAEKFVPVAGAIAVLAAEVAVLRGLEMRRQNVGRRAEANYYEAVARTIEENK